MINKLGEQNQALHIDLGLFPNYKIIYKMFLTEEYHVFMYLYIIYYARFTRLHERNFI